MENSNFEKQKTDKFEKAAKKSREFGYFSLTAQDHKDIGSTPPQELLENPEKAQYELMTEEQIIEHLDFALECLYDPICIKNGVAKMKKELFVASLPFLKSVNRLPKKFENFDVGSLPQLEKTE